MEFQAIEKILCRIASLTLGRAPYACFSDYARISQLSSTLEDRTAYQVPCIQSGLVRSCSIAEPMIYPSCFGKICVLQLLLASTIRCCAVANIWVYDNLFWNRFVHVEIRQKAGATIPRIFVHLANSTMTSIPSEQKRWQCPISASQPRPNTNSGRFCEATQRNALE
jgi:hypothetical protein